MRKEFLLPAGAVAAGIAGFFLRRWELVTAFEPDSGLPIAGMPATFCLIGLSVLVVLAALLLGLSYRKTQFPGGYDSAFYAPHPLYFAAMIVAAALMLGAGGYGIWQYASHANSDILRFVLSILCFLGAASLFILGGNNFKGERQGKYSLYLLFPAFIFCLWLVSSYQERAADPVILDYVYGLFAVTAVCLSGYFVAGFGFGFTKPHCAVMFSLMGIYFGIVALAGADLFTMLLCGAVTLYQLCNVTALLYRTTHTANFEVEVLPDEG